MQRSAKQVAHAEALADWRVGEECGLKNLPAWIFFGNIDELNALNASNLARAKV
jgi:hypothetical protein